MARFDPMNFESAVAEQQPVAAGDAFLRLGISYSTARNGHADLIAAHKWFNLAAAKGNRDALRYRQEIALEMDESEIAEAQRAAREWLSTH